MRILHLIDSDGVYGAERILLYLAREQKRLGLQPCIASIRPPGTVATDFEQLARSWELEVLPIRIQPLPTPRTLRTLLHSVRSWGADVLHSHGYKADVLLGPMPRAWRGPMLTTLHGWSHSPAFSSLWLRERLDRLALHRIDLVVSVTRAMLELPGLRGFAHHRLRVIPNGIPSRSARALDLAAGSGRIPELPVTHMVFLRARPTLVAIGRLSPEKGFDLLLEAFSRALAAGGAPHQLLIVGDGPERAALEQRIARLKLHERVRLAGYLPGADRLLQQAAGFVMSSRTEGMPVVMLEAVQWPVPILATAVGAIPELMPAGRGVLVPPGDVAALTDGLMALMSSAANPTRPQFVPEHGEDGSARMAQEYLQAYGSIVPDRQLAEAER